MIDYRHDMSSLSHDDLNRLRRDYARAALDLEHLDPDPFNQFRSWFHQACEARLTEPNAMSLATASSDGTTSLRTVLLKGFDRSGFLFFTNLESNKARQIRENPKVSLLFPWLDLERQVIINGDAETLSRSDVLRYFVTRPFGSQLSAWVSQQSRVISSRSLLEAKLEEMKRKFQEGKVPVPSFWGGFRVVPRTLEFWQGRSNRLHDRFLYTREFQDQWRVERLSP